MHPPRQFENGVILNEDEFTLATSSQEFERFTRAHDDGRGHDCPTAAQDKGCMLSPLLLGIFSQYRCCGKDLQQMPC